MLEAILEGLFRIGGAVGAVHGLEKEVLEFQVKAIFRIDSCLRENQLQFASGFLLQFSTRFWADADPVQTVRCLDGAVSFNSNLEIGGVQGVNERSIQLQQRLASGAYDKTSGGRRTGGPFFLDGCGKRFRGRELSSAPSLGISKVGVAKLADGRRPVLFPS